MTHYDPNDLDGLKHTLACFKESLDRAIILYDDRLQDCARLIESIQKNILWVEQAIKFKEKDIADENSCNGEEKNA